MWFCKIDFHRTSYARHLKTKKQSENMIQNKVIIPRKNPIKRIEKRKINISHTKLDNLYYFTDGILKVAYDIVIDYHHSKHANSTIIITSKINNIRIDINHIHKILREMAKWFAKLLNQHKFKHQLNFSESLNK